LRSLPQDPRLCGASIVFDWSEIDKGPSYGAKEYDFKPIDDAMVPWIAAGKRVNLLVAGTNELGPNDTATPSWVLKSVPTVTCRNPGGNSAAGPPTPVYWNPGYENPWRAFIRKVLQTYGSNAKVGYVRFGLGAGAEDFPQHGADGNCFGVWHEKYGLSAKFWATFSGNLTRYIARTAAASHATVQPMVALNSFDDPAAPYDVATYVAGVAARNGVGFGTENLGCCGSGSIVQPCTSAQYWCAAFTKHAGEIPLEFQPINYTLQTGLKTPIPTLPQLLRYGLENNAQIFEIYAQDWLTADDDSWPAYAAYHARCNRALTRAATILGIAPAPASQPHHEFRP